MKNKKRLVAIGAAILAILMVVSLMAGLIPAASAASTTEKVNAAKKELNELKDKQDDIQDKIDGLEDKIDDNMSEMEKICAQKNTIDQEVGLLSQQIDNINQQVAAYALLIADKQEELDAAQARLRELNAQNKARIRAMEEDGSLSYWSVLFKANSFADLLDRLNMIEEIAAADRRRLAEMNQAAEVVEQARTELETEKTALEDSKLELDQKQLELDKKRAEADALLAELNAKGDELQALLDAAEDEDEKLVREIAAAEKAYNQAMAEKKAEEDAQKNQQSNKPTYSDNLPPSSVTDGIKWLIPCKYTYLSSPYGYRIHPVYGYRKFHTGVDLAAPKGTPILATRDGTVTRAEYNSSSGYYVTLNHGDGFSTSYLHMTHYIVSPGDNVKAGQVIGYVGSTGVSTGNHLHFTLYYNGNTVNPANYLKFY